MNEFTQLQREMAADDFLQDEFKDVNLLVALPEPLQRLAELLGFVGPKMTQRGNQYQPNQRDDDKQ